MSSNKTKKALTLINTM